MDYFIQIVNEQEKKAVRFRFDSEIKALEFATVLNLVFSAAHVEAVVGTYRDGEKCPFGFGAPRDGQ